MNHWYMMAAYYAGMGAVLWWRYRDFDLDQLTRDYADL